MKPFYYRTRPITAKILLLGLVALSLSLNACGKKPGHVDPPDGVVKDSFPYVYPDLSTDPKPE